MGALKQAERVIPLIDISDAEAHPGDAARAIDQACREDGFFYLTGHGVSQDIIDAAFDASKRFFARAHDDKIKYHIRHSHPHQRGYVPPFEENLSADGEADLKESFDLGVDLAPDHPDVLAGKPFSAPNVWPDDDRFRQAISAYHTEMCALGDKLVRLTALALGLDADFFDKAMRDPVANLRLLHYPARENVPDAVGCGAHADYGFMTILAQKDVPGLEVEGENGQWHLIPPIDDTFVVNLGDLLTLWTGGQYRARLHRVAGASDQERYSIPFFLDPNVDALIETVPTCRTDGATAEPVSAGAYLQSRFDATFRYREG